MTHWPLSSQTGIIRAMLSQLCWPLTDVRDMASRYSPFLIFGFINARTCQFDSGDECIAKFDNGTTPYSRMTLMSNSVVYFVIKLRLLSIFVLRTSFDQNVLVNSQGGNKIRSSWKSTIQNKFEIFVFKLLGLETIASWLLCSMHDTSANLQIQSSTKDAHPDYFQKRAGYRAYNVTIIWVSRLYYSLEVTSFID